MGSIVSWYECILGQYIPREAFVFILSMFPFIELRGGLAVASLLEVPLLKANVICFLGNLIPVPFIMLFVQKIFEWLRGNRMCDSFVSKIENRALRKADGIQKGEFFFLLFFVGIPVPGMGAWTGTLIATLMGTNHKKAFLSILIGLVMASIIVDIVFYGVLSAILI